MKRLIIQGSSKSDGNTHRIIQLLRAELSFDLIDLNTKNIGHFDYEFNNQLDDFMPMMRTITAEYDLIVFATPVYWYSMSGLMKVFFDRISDCLKIDKTTGRKLRGKKMAMLYCGSDDAKLEGFEIPFRDSAAYLGMEYLGDVQTWLEDDGIIEEEVKKRISRFIQLLK